MTQYAVFSRAVVTIYDLPAPTKQDDEGQTLSTIGDEGLYGQVCRVVAPAAPLPAGVAEVYTFYGYHGYVYTADLLPLSDAALSAYLAADLVTVCRATDVMSLPRVSAVRLAELEAGGILRRRAQSDVPAGWAAVELADGRTGYTRDVALEPVRCPMTAVRRYDGKMRFDEALAAAEGCAPADLVPRALARWHGGSEEAFRNAVCAEAERFMGTEYRWGGKSGRGIDCSGLVSTAYLRSGVLIYRDAKLVEGWPMRQIPFEQKKRGDALYFPGHIALYLGEGRYIHSTGAAASGGVVLNSLDPSDPLYRADLVESLYAVGSIF